MEKKYHIFMFTVLLFCSLTLSASQKYYFDPEMLTEKNLELYKKSRSTLNDWSGEYEKLVLANDLIKRFINEDPNFLPIYIEKARYTIMMGNTVSNKREEYNRKALKILKELQIKDPMYPKSYVLAGHIYTNLNELHNAELSLKKANTFNINDPWLFNNWAYLLRLQKKYDLAYEYSIKGIKSSESNVKAMASAIDDYNFLSKRIDETSNQVDVVSIIFSSIKSPERRLRLSERLVNSYGGNRNILFTAYKIIERQKKETPNLVLCDIELANLVLTNGYIRSDNNIRLFTNESKEAALRLLVPNINDDSLQDRVFEMLFEIYLSQNDFKKAIDLINDSYERGVSPKILLISEIKISYLQQNYKDVIKQYDNVLKLDPSFNDNVILISSYKKLGMLDKVNEYHLNQIKMNPDSAWTIGNYANFLLYEKSDSKNAIRYGEKAMEIMTYPLIRSITALAYQIEASKEMKDGNKTSSLLLYDKSIRLGINQQYISENCMSFCKGINNVKYEYIKKIKAEKETI